MSTPPQVLAAGRPVVKPSWRPAWRRHLYGSELAWAVAFLVPYVGVLAAFAIDCLRVRDPRELGLARCGAADLAGGDAAHNAARLRAVFEGRDRGAHRDAVLLNAALALEVCGAVGDARAGVQAAAQAVDRGDASRLLTRLAAFGARAAATGG